MTDQGEEQMEARARDVLASCLPQHMEPVASYLRRPHGDIQGARVDAEIAVRAMLAFARLSPTETPDTEVGRLRERAIALLPLVTAPQSWWSAEEAGRVRDLIKDASDLPPNAPAQAPATVMPEKVREAARERLAQAFEDADVTGYARHIRSGLAEGENGWFWAKPAIAALTANAPTQAAGQLKEALELIRHRDVQAIGAALSGGNLQAIEAAYNGLRDNIDRLLINHRRDPRIGEAHAKGMTW